MEAASFARPEGVVYGLWYVNVKAALSTLHQVLNFTKSYLFHVFDLSNLKNISHTAII